MSVLASDSMMQMGFLESPTAQLVLARRRIMECNKAVERMFGYSRAELVGQSVRKLYPSAADYDAIGERCEKALQTQKYYEDERFMQRRNANIFWVRACGVTLSPEKPFDLMIWSFVIIAENVVKSVSLTAREQEIARYIVNGHTSKEIANILNISHRTVEAHRAQVMKKVGAKNAADLVSQIILIE